MGSAEFQLTKSGHTGKQLYENIFGRNFFFSSEKKIDGRQVGIFFFLFQTSLMWEVF